MYSFWINFELYSLRVSVEFRIEGEVWEMCFSSREDSQCSKCEPRLNIRGTVLCLRTEINSEVQDYPSSTYHLSTYLPICHMFITYLSVCICMHAQVHMHMYIHVFFTLTHIHNSNHSLLYVSSWSGQKKDMQGNYNSVCWFPPAFSHRWIWRTCLTVTQWKVAGPVKLV